MSEAPHGLPQDANGVACESMSAHEDIGRKFLMLGSGEFEPWAADVEREAIASATGDITVLIVPTASVPDRGDSFSKWARMGLDHYAWLGVPAKVPVRDLA